MSQPPSVDPVEAAVDRILARGGDHVNVGAPLGLGKPNRLLNALYRRFKNDRSKKLSLYTALSLAPPRAKSDLERRFLDPFVARHFGDAYPRLEYLDDLLHEKLPDNVRVQEFYFASGAMMQAARAQRDYASMNYTMVARDLTHDAELHAFVQLVARREGPNGVRYSLSCNPDITLDVIDKMVERGMQRPLLVGVVHPDLPFLGGSADLPASMIDVVVEESAPVQPLFALPREPLGVVDHAIGLHASSLVMDGGTLQIGIGALSDAIVHATLMRHRANAEYRAALQALRGNDAAADPLVVREGGVAPFEKGLYGASEMVMDGFMHLRRAGILRRVVVDDEDVQRALDAGESVAADRLAGGHYLKGAFFLGSKELYAWLASLSGEDFEGLAMTRVSDVNQLYGGREKLDAMQRKDARFFNTCMIATALGAAASDMLEDGRVVSGVGGQYNFVAMAHAISGGRSALLFRATRTHGDRVDSNVRFAYGHTTIPRHLRDLFVNEYGIADVRGKTDEECVKAMLSITDARFQDEIVRAAIRGKKLPASFVVPDAWRRNTPEALADRMRPLRSSGAFPTFPFGSDFTPVEERLLPALGWLKTQRDAEDWGALMGAALFTGRSPEDDACLERMGLGANARTFKERMLGRLVRGALARTSEAKA